MKIKQKIYQLFNFISTLITFSFDVRDFILFSGLFFVSYGLWLYAPWIGFTVGGFLLMILALAMKQD
jgi:hypothetical protein